MNGQTPTSIKGNAPLKIMALDLEVLPPKTNSMPDPNNDPIIICSMGFYPPDPISGESTLITMKNDDEATLIKAITSVLLMYDPDIIAGHNINGFDLEYLTIRAQRNGVNLKWGRDGSQLRYNYERKLARVTGRIVVDTLSVLRKNYSLRNYKLATVAELVSMKKGDVEAKEIRGLWLNHDRRLLDYARQDAKIVLALLRDLRPLDKYIELSKLTGQLLQDVIDGGQSGMIESLLLREFNRKGRLLAVKPDRDNVVDDDEVKYEGAKVLDPKLGLTEDVLILDFTSLYPTIIMSNNLCYSTIIPSGESFESIDMITTPSGAAFVKAEVYEGILPCLLRRIFDERLAIKDIISKTGDQKEKSLLDARQYGLKILLNSIYGYAGYTGSRLFVQELAESVTAFGRENLLRTKNIIENDLKFEVIGGDTDSVFVKDKLPGSNFSVHASQGDAIARQVTQGLPSPMALSFESYAKRMLILSKKRYVAYLYDGHEYRMKIKGIEVVRRDWCPLTSEMLDKMLNFILKDGNITAAVDIVRSVVKTINRICDSSEITLLDLKPFILTRRYRGANESKIHLAHDEVVKKCESRGDKSYFSGDRVEFVVVSGGTSDFSHDYTSVSKALKNRAEDPEYVIKNKMLIDEGYYINKQILPPALRVLEPFGITENVLLEREDSVDKRTFVQTCFDNWR